jgi:hypothetical protein
MITRNRELVLAIGGLLLVGGIYLGIYFMVISGLLVLGILLWLVTSKAN